MAKSKEVLNCALEYARAGMAVFPLGVKSKTPATRNGFKDATASEEVICEFWKENDPKPCNIAIATGTPSGGLIAIDVDVHDGTENSLNWIKKWELDNEPLPDTWISKTGTGGLHALYTSEQPVKCSVSRALGIDVRAEGGYIVAPPSIHPNGNAYEWLKKPGKTPAKANEVVFKFLRDVQNYNGKKKAEKYSLPKKIGKGQRNDEIFKYACSMQAQGMGNNKIWDELLVTNEKLVDPPLSEVELRKIYNSALTHDKGISLKNMPYELVRAKDKRGNETGAILPSLTNLVTVLENDERLANHFFYDERAYTKMVIDPLPNSWRCGEGTRQFRDTDVIEFKYYLENLTNPTNESERCPIFASSQTCSEALEKVCMNHRRNLVTEWLDSLTWDGEDRMDGLLWTFLGAEMSDYTVEVTRLLMFGAIARAYHAGSKFDYMPVLVGRQGLGKSYFLRKLAHCSDWFLDNLTTMEGDGAIEKLRGMWIVEVAELASIKKDKIETIKAFITQINDVYRPKYGRETIFRPRSCVFCGTTNSTAFLADITGNRRFLPVDVGLCEPQMSLFDNGVDEYFNQCWAEAVFKFRSTNPTLILSSDSEEQAKVMQETYQEDDPQIGQIEQYLNEKLSEYLASTSSPKAEECSVCALEIAKQGLGLSLPKRYEINDIHRIMSARIAGWRRASKKRYFKDYGSQNCYIPSLPERN